MWRPLLKSIFLCLALGLFCLVSMGWYLSAPAYEGPISDHFDGTKFHNEIRLKNGFWDFLKWTYVRKPGEWPKSRPNKAYPPPQQRVWGDPYVVTFVNHATVLIQIAGLNILTDPIWSQRCSPFSFAGPRRVREPGLSFDNLPPIDVVLVSHNHYDHLDIATLKRLRLRDNPRVFAGLGNQAFLAAYGIESVDLDWWQAVDLSPELRLWATPAQHFSNRGLNDRNKSLWMGFVIEGRQGMIYFAGDTGFGPHFQQIFDHFGPIDVALLPIGAFVPQWFMHIVHMSPAEALRAASILHARASIGIHFGTFALADDAEEEPLRELARAKAQLGDHTFNTLDFGQGQEFRKN